MDWVWTILILGAIGFWIYKANCTPEAITRSEDKQHQQQEQQSKLLCPHCQERGGVTVREITRKKGVSGAKATGAVLTGGVSMLATGLSRKENSREMSCASCGMKWDVA
jgi:hypothetical protein